jgi:hypothetical protein
MLSKRFEAQILAARAGAAAAKTPDAIAIRLTDRSIALVIGS